MNNTSQHNFLNTLKSFFSTLFTVVSYPIFRLLIGDKTLSQMNQINLSKEKIKPSSTKENMPQKDKPLAKENNFNKEEVKSQNASETKETVNPSVHHEDWKIRYEIAKKGNPQDLDILVNDTDEYVRSAVAMHGRNQDLDILINDDNWLVKETVIKHGRPQDLDILVHDEDDYIRKVVLEQGRIQDINILVNDQNPDIKKQAELYLQNIQASPFYKEEQFQADLQAFSEYTSSENYIQDALFEQQDIINHLIDGEETVIYDETDDFINNCDANYFQAGDIVTEDGVDILYDEDDLDPSTCNFEITQKIKEQKTEKSEKTAEDFSR